MADYDQLPSTATERRLAGAALLLAIGIGFASVAFFRGATFWWLLGTAVAIMFLVSVWAWVILLTRRGKSKP